MRLRTGALMVVVFVVAVFTWGRAAQADCGILSGTIKDAAGVAVPGVTAVEAESPMTASAPDRRARRLSHPQPRARQLRRHREAGGVRDHDNPGDDSGHGNETRIALEIQGRSAHRKARPWRERRLPRSAPGGPAGPSTNSRTAVHSRTPRRCPASTGGSPAGAASTPSRTDYIDREWLQARLHGSALHLLGRRGHGVVRQRPPLPAEGRLPYPGAVRIEELMNYFRLPYAEPVGPEPFSITTELSECPWNPRTAWPSSASRGAR